MLGYHRVADAADPWGISVSPANFAAQMDVLARVAQPMRLVDAAGRLASGDAPRRAVVVTFDDGYADNLYNALPALEAAAVPATVFVTTGSLGREYWWDELARLVARSESVPALKESWARARQDGPSVGARDPGPSLQDRGALLLAMAMEARALPAADRGRVLERLRSDLADASPGEAIHRALSVDELRELADHAIVDIGSHTVSHPSLADLPPEEQRAEVVQSGHALSRITGAAVVTLSYPNGSYSSETLRIVREAGFLAACSSVPDLATPRAEPLALPRLWVDDWPASTFADWIERWIHD